MNYFDPVVIGCYTDGLDCALAVRAALESFRLRVHLYHLVQKRNVLDFLQGDIPPSDYVVMVTGGIFADGGYRHDEPPDRMAMGFLRVVEEADGKWDTADFALTPPDVPKLVKLPGRTVISTACGSGREPFGKAFLDAGCRAYIGPDGEVNEDALVAFPIMFFYHLLSSTRPKGGECDDKTAAERAGQVDTISSEGTHVFRYYGSLQNR